MKKDFFNSKNGFSLIELLVVAAILSILGLLSATIVSNILSSQNRTLITTTVKQNGDYITQIFERDVKQARTATAPDCTANSCILTLTGDSGTVATWTCERSGSPLLGVIRRRSGTGVDEAISVPDTKSGTNVYSCSDPAFAPTPNIFTVSGDLVKINFKLKNAVDLPDRAEFKTSIDFVLTVQMRLNSFAN